MKFRFTYLGDSISQVTRKFFSVGRILFFLIILFLTNKTSAQDNCYLRISLLTCNPGEELYSSFGHTAIRVQDGSTGTDYVYNYGTFEFGPDFYTEFIQGKLLYFLSVQEYEEFLYQYRYESRSVHEQVLQLSCNSLEHIVQALDSNALESNRYYRYDFLFDNCTTRARDIIRAHSGSPVVFKNILPETRPSFRDLIHSYLDQGRQPWSKLGIDILLGKDLDRKVTNLESMFLPDYLMKGFDSALVNERPLVTPAQTVLAMPLAVKKENIFRPAVVFSLLLALFVFLSFYKTKRTRSILQALDIFIFALAGLAGLLLLFMWFGTDHVVCRNNLNLLWALPTHLIAAFFISGRKKWAGKYFLFSAILNTLLLATWFFLPQNLNDALIPLVMILAIRSWMLSKKQL